MAERLATGYVSKDEILQRDFITHDFDAVTKSQSHPTFHPGGGSAIVSNSKELPPNSNFQYHFSDTTAEKSYRTKKKKSKKKKSKKVERGPKIEDSINIQVFEECTAIIQHECNINLMTEKIIGKLYDFSGAISIYLLRLNKGKLVIDGFKQNKTDTISVLQRFPISNFEGTISTKIIEQSKSKLDCIYLTESKYHNVHSIQSVICLPIVGQSKFLGCLYGISNQVDAFSSTIYKQRTVITLILALLINYINNYIDEFSKHARERSRTLITVAHQSSQAILQDSLLKYDPVSEEWKQIFVVLSVQKLSLFATPYDTNPLRSINIENLREIEIFSEKIYDRTKSTFELPKFSKKIRLQCSIFFVFFENSILWFASPSLETVFKWVKQIDGLIKKIESQNDNNFRIPSDIRLLSSEIQLSDKLGQGGEGVVYKALWNSVPVAVKQLYDSFDNESSFYEEISILRELRHPNIVMLFGGFFDSNNRPCIVTEFATRGSLDKVLYESNTLLSTELKLSIVRQLATALNYLHCLDSPVVHRDLKPANVLVCFLLSSTLIFLNYLFLYTLPSIQSLLFISFSFFFFFFLFLFSCRFGKLFIFIILK